MMGQRTAMQEELFHGFGLERHVPNDHMLRARYGAASCCRS